MKIDILTGDHQHMTMGRKEDRRSVKRGAYWLIEAQNTLGCNF
jgi:hypothetical protein